MSNTNPFSNRISLVTKTEIEGVDIPGNYKEMITPATSWALAYPSGKPHSFWHHISEALETCGQVCRDEFPRDKPNELYFYQGLFLYEIQPLSYKMYRVKSIEIIW